MVLVLGLGLGLELGSLEKAVERQKLTRVLGTVTLSPSLDTLFT